MTKKSEQSEQSEKNKVEHEEQMSVANKVMEEDKEVLKRYAALQELTDQAQELDMGY